MGFWIRDATLILNKRKYALGNMNFSFEVPFEDSDEPPVATIKVMNLSANTRASIKKNDPVILNAGYAGNVGCILIGKVVGLKHNQSNTDWTTTITVMPNSDEILNSLINKTYVENSSASTIVRDLLNIFGVEVGKCELTTDQIYPRGRVCKGKLKQVLTDIVVTECNSRFVIRPTGQVYITKADDAINNGVTLSVANGLLRADVEEVTVPIESKSTSTTDEEDSTISRTCLLHYEIAPAEVVQLSSSTLNGKFLVVKGKHIGGRTGDWKTTMELKTYFTSASSLAVSSVAASVISASESVANALKSTLKFGSRGDAVKELQTLLNNNGANLEVDGIFGQETRAAVLKYQQDHDLTADGIAGAETWNSLLGG